MDFAEAIAIFVSRILALTMVDGLVAEAPLRQSAIDRVLVGVAVLIRLLRATLAKIRGLIVAC